MSIFVKICGICSRADLEQICALGPDAIGFVFWPKSKRYVRPEQAARWMDAVPESIKKVGVFVEPAAEEAEAVARECRLDVVQIHVRSNDWKIDRPLFQGLETWLASRSDQKPTSDVFAAVSPEPTMLLCDAFDAEKVGGSGTLGDWGAAIEMKKIGKPLLLAGGLTPDNVEEAVRVVHPWGVDVSTGVEKECGVKNIRKVKKFITAARG